MAWRMETADKQEEFNRWQERGTNVNCTRYVEEAVGWISVLARVRYTSSEECLSFLLYIEQNAAIFVFF